MAAVKGQSSKRQYKINTGNKIKFSIKNFFNQWDQIRKKF